MASESVVQDKMSTELGSQVLCVLELSGNEYVSLEDIVENVVKVAVYVLGDSEDDPWLTGRQVELLDILLSLDPEGEIRLILEIDSVGEHRLLSLSNTNSLTQSLRSDLTVLRVVFLRGVLLFGYIILLFSGPSRICEVEA